MFSHFYQKNIIEKPKIIFAILLICLVSFGFFIKDFRLDASSETLLIDGDPDLKYLRESGSIEQDADVVMFVFREAYYIERNEPQPNTVEHAEWQSKMNDVSNRAEIIIGKQRHGPTGNVFLEFEPAFTKFKDIQNS